MSDNNYMQQLERDNEELREKLEVASMTTDKYFSALKLFWYIMEIKHCKKTLIYDIEDSRDMNSSKPWVQQHYETLLEIPKEFENDNTDKDNISGEVP